MSNLSNKVLLKAAKYQEYSFSVSELLIGNQQVEGGGEGGVGVGGIISPSRLGLTNPLILLVLSHSIAFLFHV